MDLVLRQFEERDLSQMNAIWNSIVEEGDAFPQTERLDMASGLAFFRSQSFAGVAEDRNTGNIAGLYILHPNNVGRCSHIANASYAVAETARGRQVGRQLVTHCLSKAKALGFRILQFNAVVKTNTAAIRLYRALGFTPLGVIPGGFLKKDGTYEDIIPFYKTL